MYEVYRKSWIFTTFFLLCGEIQEKDGILFLLDDKGEVLGLLNVNQFAYAIKQ